MIIRGTQELKNYLGLADDWLHTSRQVQSNFAISNIPPALMKFSFLFLARSSNYLYPKRNLNFKTTFQHGVHLVFSRYSTDALNKIFGTTHIPYIDTKHYSFIYKLFLFAHTRYIPGHHSCQLAHLPMNTTVATIKSGPFGCITSNQRNVVRKLCQTCTLCIRQEQFTKGRGYSNIPGDPRLLTLLNVDSPIFYFASVDILPPFWVNYKKGSHAGKFPIYILNTVDLATGLVLSSLSRTAQKKKLLQG